MSAPASSSAGLPEGARVVLATHNAGKVRELRQLIAGAVPGLEVETAVVDAGAVGAPDVVEDGVTFAQNALKKARAVAAHTGLIAVADDSGLAVDVLHGAPGIFSARWAGRHGDDAANLDLLLGQLADVPDKYRGAAFVSAAALVLPDGTEVVRMGKVSGQLLHERHGEGGFGYDPIFRPDGYEVTTAQMSPEQKNQISHRGISFRALAKDIAPLL